MVSSRFTRLPQSHGSSTLPPSPQRSRKRKTHRSRRNNRRQSCRGNKNRQSPSPLSTTPVRRRAISISLFVRGVNCQSLGYTMEEVIGFLSEPRDSSAKKAYNLIAETEAIHRTTEKAQDLGLTKNDSYLSASPPPWNHS